MANHTIWDDYVIVVSYVTEGLYVNGRYRIRTCDLTGVIRAL